MSVSRVLPGTLCCEVILCGCAVLFGEDLTVVVVGGDERQPVSNPLESIRRKAAVPALPMAFSVRQWSASAVVTLRPSGEFHSPRTRLEAEPSTAASLVRSVCVEKEKGSVLSPDQGV